MAKKAYFSPILLSVGDGNIDLRPSQEGSYGGGDTDHDDFWAWWNSDDVQENMDTIRGSYPDFDPDDSSTYPSGFDINDPDTWDILFG